MNNTSALERNMYKFHVAEKAREASFYGIFLEKPRKVYDTVLKKKVNVPQKEYLIKVFGKRPHAREEMEAHAKKSGDTLVLFEQFNKNGN